MNKEQTQHVNSFDTTLSLLNLAANKPIWIGNATFSAEVSKILAFMVTLNKADAVRLTNSQPITETKGQAKVILIESALHHAIAGAGYAATINDTNLKATCTIAPSTLASYADADLGNACMNIYTTVQPLIANLSDWAVDATSLATLLSDINTFNALVGAPVAQISTQNAASADIDTQIADIEAVFSDKIDTLMNQFKTNHTSFYNAYFAARKVHGTGQHHSTSFTGYVYKTGGAALINALVTLSFNGEIIRKHYTDGSGHYRFTRLHVGAFTLEVTCPGYVTQNKVMNVTVLQVVETDFTMVNSGGTGGGSAPAPVSSEN